MPITTCIFDAYRTLFYVAAAALLAAAAPTSQAFAPLWRLAAKTWRLQQLPQTWLRTGTGAPTAS